ncbi:MAG: PAS domain S-box protein [Nitrosomonadales bacterium]|nr:PAS domain S-box protein [Nitrosomonadales bacterium]
MIRSHKQHRDDYRRAIFKRFLAIALLFAMLLVAAGIAHYYTERKLERSSIEFTESHNVAQAHEAINNTLRGVVSDLAFLSKLNELRDLLDNPGNERAMQMLAKEFLSFSEMKRVYDQIRLLDSTGMEVVRINYEKGKPLIAPAGELQNKANRYYFSDIMATGSGHIYLSPFDLNIEGERVETPLKPVIRFAIPLLDKRGLKKYVLVLNYMGEGLIRNFKKAAAGVADHIYLVNAEGYWLSSPKPEDEWGFIFEHRHSFSNRYPRAWEGILTSNSGVFQNEDGYFTYSTLDPTGIVRESFFAIMPGAESAKLRPPSNGQAGSWKIISHVSPGVMNPAAKDFLRDHLMLYVTAILLLFSTSLIIAQTSVRRQLARTRDNFRRRMLETLENMQLPSVTLDAAGHITFCNRFFSELVGWPHQKLIGLDWFDTFVSNEEKSKAREAFTKMMNGEAPPATFETHIRAATGETRLLVWNNSLSHSPAGQVIALTSIGQDVTEQQRSAEQLHKLSCAVDQSPNPVLITNAEGVIEYVNPKFTELTGYTAEEAIGKRSSILKSGETSHAEYGKLWETITTGKEWRGVFHNSKKSGELYWEAAAISPIRNSKGCITHYLAIKEDITERLQLRKEVEARNRELAHAQTHAAMGRMASMVAHDLRNPLSSVKMTLQILGKRATEQWGEEAGELKQIALEQVRYMEEILTDLLQFSRPDDLKPQWVDINKVLDMAVSTTEREVHERGAKVVTEYERQLPTLHGDPTRLRQVFSNLIMNAIQSTEEIHRQPHILIRTGVVLDEGVAPKIRIEICDNGPGVDHSQIEKLFEPFFTTRAKGTGLGLPIVKRIVDQHQGTIDFATAPGGGACAIVVLPTGPIGTDVGGDDQYITQWREQHDAVS